MSRGETAGAPRALETLHGPLALPAFLPDATRTVVRGVEHRYCRW